MVCLSILQSGLIALLLQGLISVTHPLYWYSKVGLLEGA
jgi:hypothetical protein